MGVTTPTAFGGLEVGPLDPERQFEAEQAQGSQLASRLRTTVANLPSSRQRTQGEIINLALAYERLGNPFSVRRIPFSILRDMTTDPMLGFAHYYQKIPLMRADWKMNCQDAQIAAAVDEALRPKNPRIQNQLCGKLSYGYQPMCKRFKLGQLSSVYRDATSADPEKDIPTWASDQPALLFDDAQVLAPEHCLPYWNDRGELGGFNYSIFPIPTPGLLPGAVDSYGYAQLGGPGVFQIPGEFAVWPVNERDSVFGSIYGYPRLQRAYRYWWSYWYRWALSDRIFESAADPVKIVYYPTDIDSGIDADDPTAVTAASAQARALSIGQQARQGATLALPGDFMTDPETQRVTNVRKWAISYLENKADFSALDSTFGMLDALKFRAYFLPEEAFVQPGQGQSKSARNVATQLGELYQEAAQLLASENDDEINQHWIPQFIAANFPDRADTPCTKETLGFGSKDAETISQIIQLVGQVKGEVLPIDIRELFRQMGLPLLSEQQKKQEAEIEKEAAAQQPPPMPPAKVGMQGYNSGVTQTSDGRNIYYNGPQRIDLSTSNQGFLSSLPNVPAYKDASIRASMMRLRKLFLDRYETQLKSFSAYLRERTTLRLAQQANDVSQPGVTTQQPQQQKQGISASAAVGVAAAIVGAWVGVQTVDDTAGTLTSLLSNIASRAGLRELKLANLGSDLFDETALNLWAQRRSQFVVGSVDSTLRGELTNFLTDQLQQDTDPTAVAQAAEDRFSDTAKTHAERVVLAESLPAYNFGMLTAMHDAGVSQVQAHDASDGLNQLTDAECKQRDGEIMTVAQALSEASDEHPAGTLYFTALSTDALKLERVSAFPGDIEGEEADLARYDSSSEILYVLDRAGDEQERMFALTVGGSLLLN